MHKKKIVFLIDAHDAKVLHRHASIPQMSRHTHSFQNTRWVRGGTDRTGSAMEHRSVSCPAAAKMMPLDEACESPALAGSDNMHELVRVENAHHHSIAGVRAFFTLNRNFPKESGRRDIRLLEVAGHRLVDAFRLDEFNKPELHGIIAVFLFCLFLDDDAGARLNDRDGNDTTIVLQQLRHPHFLTE